jgi:hypothetical protein
VKTAIKDVMHPHPPALFSPVRIAALLTALLVSLGSGTNYVRGIDFIINTAASCSAQVFSGMHVTVILEQCKIPISL